MVQYTVLVGVDIMSVGVKETYNDSTYGSLEAAKAQAKSINSTTGRETYVVHYENSPKPIIDKTYGC